ncbi:MAG: PEP-utilizing enzyme, partial [Planctomycetota bacterium]|nr:PEP-utilizing enzyme [Planctomycetota bacterium]
FFRERSDDVRDLAGRLQRHVRKPKAEPSASLAGRVAVLADLAPSRMVSLCAEGVAAVLAGGGGATSHAALLARSLDLPLVVGLGDFLHEVRDGQNVLVDASAGEVVLDPPESLVAEAMQTATAGVQALREAYGDQDVRSGRIRFEANVSLWGDAVRADENDADGIGLYRTEFAFLMRPDLPGEAEQSALYRRIVETVAPKPVTFRLLDAGGDKLVPGLGLSAEPNPFLGYRSLRLLLDHPEILLAQARAILSALKGTEGRLLVPMVGSVEEFREVRRVLADAGLSLPHFGAMIELPCALLQVEEIAAEADFLCVGTNDLTQHILGVDRTNARVTRYFDMCHPSVVRALARIARATADAGKSLSICGEGASDPLLLALWLGLGVERLAVHSTRLRILRTLEAQLDEEAARASIAELLTLDRADDIAARLADLAAPEVQQFSRGQRRAHEGPETAPHPA